MFDHHAILDGYWKRPLNLCLPCTHQGEIRIPFEHYVRESNALPNAYFPQFTHLPLELQLRVLYWCRPSTLFHLMHTSRYMRSEATNLFFSDPAAVYLIDSEWLLEDGGDTGYTLYDLDFVLRVEHLYIDFLWMHASNWMNPANRDVYIGTDEEAAATAYGGMNENIKKFWRIVQLRFPQLKHVTLADNFDISSWGNDSHLPPDIYIKVGKMCPVDIKVSVALFQSGDGSRERRVERTLWRLATSQTNINTDTDTDFMVQWEKQSPWCDPLIIMPRKILRGPVGKFLNFQIRDYHERLQKLAIRMHKLAAVEKYYFDRRHGSFGCSATDCNIVFKHPEEYTSHAIETSHDKRRSIPETYEDLFTENDIRLSRLAKDRRKSWQDLDEWWGPEDSSQRQTAEKEVMHQLENDELLRSQDKPASENKWLKRIRTSFNEAHL